MGIWLRRRTTLKSNLCILLSLFFTASLIAQDACVNGSVDLPVMRHKKIANITIPNAVGVIQGYLEILPPDYYTSTKQYPVVIFWHGYGEFGSGSIQDLCNLLGTWVYILPMQLERNKDPKKILDQYGKSHSFIYISPQINWGQAVGSQHVDALLDYILNRYIGRADPRKVYMTGISNGGSITLNYASSSVARAKRLAGIVPVAGCASTSPQGVANMAAANLAVWSIRCSYDNVCGSSASWWVNQLNATNPAPIPYGKYTELPDAGYACNPGFPHDAWSLAYDSVFKVNGKNIWEWMVQFTQTNAALLPVALKNFTARLNNGKVHLKWTTSAEANSSNFIIEKAGGNQQFTQIATLPAAGNSSTEKNYEWIDNQPYKNLNLYRLVQTDANGKKHHFDIKKILNASDKMRLITVSPNPFVAEVSAFINIDKSQKIVASITDINGRKLKSVNSIYPEGTSEINLKAIDLPKGIYFFKIEGENFTETQKIIKQ